LADGRSKLMKDDLRPAGECWAGYCFRPEARGVAITPRRAAVSSPKRDERGE
jgi:hypothetical protein